MPLYCPQCGKRAGSAVCSWCGFRSGGLVLTSPEASQPPVEQSQDDASEPATGTAIAIAWQPNAPTSFRRKVASLFLGFFYGGTVVNGIDEGLRLILKQNDYALIRWPLVELAAFAVAAAVGAFLAAYCAQLRACGVIAACSILVC